MSSATYVNESYILKYIHKQDFALNNQQWLICHKIEPNQTNLIYHLYLFKCVQTNDRYLIVTDT